MVVSMKFPLGRCVAFVIPFFFAFGPVSGAEQKTPSPNVVLILADDLGWQDVGCYDIDKPTPMDTPNIDALAKRGILFRQGYSPAPTCAPHALRDYEWEPSSSRSQDPCARRRAAPSVFQIQMADDGALV